MVAPSHAADLEFDGERFVPGAAVEIAYLHWQRYVFAVPLAQGKRVLDVACGEGYGSAAVAAVAAHVDAFDKSGTAIAHARETYGQAGNVEYLAMDSQGFFEKAAASKYDLVLVFEFIEHLPESEQRLLLRNIKGVLAPKGLVLISTPDKRLYSDGKVARNRFHVREFYRSEFEELLRKEFKTVRVFEQLSFTGAVLAERGATEASLSQMYWTDLLKLKGRVNAGFQTMGEYLVAACAADMDAADVAIEGNVVIDQAKKLIGEELYEKHLECERARREAAAALKESEASRIGWEGALAEVETIRKTWVSPDKAECLEQMRMKTVERLMEAIARSGAQVAEGRQAQAECDMLRSELERLRLELQDNGLSRAELNDMVSLRAILRAKRYWDRFPRVKAIVKAILGRIV